MILIKLDLSPIKKEVITNKEKKIKNALLCFCRKKLKQIRKKP